MKVSRSRIAAALATLTIAFGLVASASRVSMGASGNGDPPGRYTLYPAAGDAGPTAYDTMTGLTWTTQNQNGGVAVYQNVAAANCAAFGGGWRLPTVKELSTLVDLNNPGLPYFDQSVFGTTAFTAWSSTLGPLLGPYGGYPQYYLFNFGVPETAWHPTNVARAYLCVRP